MNKNMTKADFIRNCFCEVLEDGKSHRYREIYDYACTKSVGTTFEGQLDLRNFILAFSNHLEQPDFPYMRVRFGYYQKMTPAMICGAVGDRQLNRVYELLDAATALQQKARDVYTDEFAHTNDDDAPVSQIYKSVYRKSDELIDCLSAWLAETEDLLNEVEQHQEAEPGIGPQLC